MSTEEALGLFKGAYVMHAMTTPAWKPLRVTDVWTNTKQTIVQIRIDKVAGQQWLDATGYDWCPADEGWSEFKGEWFTKEEIAQLVKDGFCAQGEVRAHFVFHSTKPRVHRRPRKSRNAIREPQATQEQPTPSTQEP